MAPTKKDIRYPKPLMLKPSEPPVKTKPLNYYYASLVEPFCHCDAHVYDPQLKRYEQLAEKEKQLHIELIRLNEQIANLSNEILDHPCDTDDDKLIQTYVIDYKKRGKDITKYIKLAPAVESSVIVPLKPSGPSRPYRDPANFRFPVYSQPTIQPCQDNSFCTTPVNMDNYFKPLTGRSEYGDNISKIGLSVMKNFKQYKEPLPSSRRRFGETNM